MPMMATYYNAKKTQKDQSCMSQANCQHPVDDSLRKHANKETALFLYYSVELVSPVR